MIPEWLSFLNEFIPSPYISLYLFTWHRNDILFPDKPFRKKFIPVLIKNQILVLVRIFIFFFFFLNEHYSGLKIANRVVWSEWRMRNWSGAKTCSVRFYNVNTVWTSFWNKTHSGVKVITASQKRPLSWVHYVFCRYLWAWLDLFQRLLLLNK